MKNQVERTSRLTGKPTIGVRIGQWFRHLDPRLAHRELDLQEHAQRGERARIARDLHDTLFQGFLGAKMQLHAVVEQLPPDSPSRPALHRVLEQMERAIEQGRDAVRGLRAFAGQSRSLEQALARVRDEFAPLPGVEFRMFLKGTPRLLNREVQDEVYHIGREALINAMRHSQAKRIEIEVEYCSRRLRVTTRDDGCGIDPRVFESVRGRQWGLVGMRERAEDIGARLRVLSRPGGGTEIEVTVPGDRAFDEESVHFFPNRGRLART
jgi:signal transduction histidine kinase